VGGRRSPSEAEAKCQTTVQILTLLVACLAHSVLAFRMSCSYIATQVGASLKTGGSAQPKTATAEAVLVRKIWGALQRPVAWPSLPSVGCRDKAIQN